MKKILVFLFGTYSLGASAQLEKEYTPIVYTGAVPTDFIYDPQNEISRLMLDEKILDKKSSREFHTAAEYEMERMLSGGKVYFNDPISLYLNDIARELLTTKPELTGKIKIYASRSSAINAQSLPDGHIFINVGLINAMENADQLAFIIAHEITHYANKHAVNTYKRRINIASQETAIVDDDGERYRNLRYSRENEFESDASGLQLVIGSSFNAAEAVKALRNLEKNDSADVAINLESYFNSELFTIDTAWINEKSIKTWKKNASRNNEKRLLEDDDEDIYLSHPDIEKRALALEEILQATDYKYTAKEKNEKFDEIKQMASFEIVENSHRDGAYSFSIYQSLKLLKTYPDNLFLNINVIRSLYWLCHMREIDAIDKVLYSNGLATGRNYDKLNTFLSKPGISEYKKLSYGFLKSRIEKFKGYDDFAFYQGVITEQYLGKEAANVYYNAYSVKYPAGKNINFVNRKLKSTL